MRRFGVATWALMVLVVPLSAQQTVQFSGHTWTVTAPDARVEPYLGREALRLRNGGVFLTDVAFGDGVVEYDVATTGHRSFVGAALRLRQGERVTYEEFYLRPHQSGRFDALQYTPNFGGLTAWQLYPEYNRPVQIPRDRWIHVRLVVSGTKLTAFIDDSDEPAMVVEDLRLGPEPGGVGLYSNFPEAGTLDLYPTAFSNFELKPAVEDPESPQAVSDPPSAPPGVIEAWAVSEAIPGDGAPVLVLDREALDALNWDVLPTDPVGRINIAEYRAFPPQARQGRVFARVLLHSDAPRTVKLNFGFSDRGSVFLNGELRFTGNNTYRSRSLRYLGAMTLDNDALYLPLLEGENELVVAVTEAFGGWGLVAKLGDAEGVRVSW
jgi:hypothetical protein